MEFLSLSEASSMKTFDLKYCRSKLEDHYQKTATVPTSVWCKKSVVDIHQIYTRLSWVKEKHTPAGTTQSELKHYSDLLTADKNGAIPKRILVQGQTGIGKSTFVKKLLVDWVEVNKETGDEQTSVLKNFELVVAVNLKEVSKCQSLEDVIRMSNVFAKEDKYMTDGLIDYITNNQEKVLLIFDGYDEYRSGCSSEIYEIFRGSSLRSCCVLITTRISKADELRGLEDLHAEITGFSEVDRRDFMRRFLADDEASDLYRHLLDRNLQELTKVPLLLLFFCTLWKRGQSKVFPKSKTELYTYIIQFIINHSHIKRSPPHYVNLQSSKEILSEIGKVALQGLLNDDHLFEYSQLSDAVLCDESVFIGLLQITEYTETLQPVGMVSFIHKSIQEFLAAWYIIYKCIPEGGSVGEIGVKLEECLALENVFQFMCGLSEDGASMAFTHLKSVRISDPSLDLSKAIPDLDKETDVPLSDVTDRQRIFNDLVLNSFEEVKSKAELSETCLDCLGSIFLLPSNYMKSFPEDLLLKLRDANTLSFIFEYRELYSELYGRSPEASIQLSRMIDLTKLQVIESFEREKLRKFLIDFLNINHYCFCRFFAVICIRNGQVYFYIKHLKMTCDLHARLITDNVVHSHAAHSSLRQPCLKYLKTLNCFKSDDLMAFPFIKKCKTPPYPPSNDPLKRMMRSFSDKALCPFLEQVPNPSSCTLSIKRCDLTSKGAVKLASLLPIFENVTKLDLSLAVCSAKSVTILVTAIKHKTLVDLILSEIHLTSAVVDALGQSLPELSTLRALRISGMNVCFNEAATRLCAAIKHKSLEVLELSEINMHSAAAEVLGQSLPKLSALQALKISGLAKFSDEKVTFILVSAVAKTLGQSRALSALQKLEISSLDGSRLLVRFVESTLHLEPFEVLKIGGPEPFQTLEIGGLSECSAKAVTRLFTAFKDKTLKKLKLSKIMLTSAVAEALGQSLPEFSAVDSLEISGSDGCSLQDKEMEALFGRFNRPSPLVSLVIDHFSLKGSLSVLTKNLHFFPRLKYLDLSITVDEADLFGLLEKMELLPELENLTLKGIALSHSIRSMVPQLLKLKKLEMLCLKTEDFLKEDLFYVQDAFKGKLRQLTIDVTNYGKAS